MSKATPTPAPGSKIRSPLLPIFLIVLVDILGMTLIWPLLPFYSERLGATPSQVGFLVATYAFFQLVSGPILGSLSDRTGRKPMLIVSQIGTFIGFLILARADALWLVFLSRAIDGATAGNLSIAQAYISDVTEPKNRAKAFGVIGIAFGIGFLLGPAISGILSQYGYHVPVYAAAGLSLLSIITTYRILPSSEQMVRYAPQPDEDPGAPAGQRLGLLSWGKYAGYFRTPELGPLLVEFFLFCFFFSIFIGGFALFAERRFTYQGEPFGPTHVGYVYAFSGFLGIFLQGGLVGKLVARFGERRMIRVGFASSAIGYAILGWAYRIPHLLSSSVFAATGSSILRPTLTSLITQKVGRREQGVVLGLTQSLNCVASIVGPLIGGVLIEHGYLSFWGWMPGIIALGALVLASRKSRLPVAEAKVPQ